MRYDEFKGTQDQLADAFAECVYAFQVATAPSEVDNLDEEILKALDTVLLVEV